MVEHLHRCFLVRFLRLLEGAQLRHRVFVVVAVGGLALTGPPASAATIRLFDWGVSLEGTTLCKLGPCDVDGASPSDLPSAFDTSAFDFASGLGEILVTLTGAGSHQVMAFLDHEIDASTQHVLQRIRRGPWCAGGGAELGD